MTERPRSEPHAVVKPQNEAHAVRVLPDAPFIAYALMQGFKVIMSLFIKRWPGLDSRVRYD
jgi:hypothetical protein